MKIWKLKEYEIMETSGKCYINILIDKLLFVE